MLQAQAPHAAGPNWVSQSAAAAHCGAPPVPVLVPPLPPVDVVDPPVPPPAVPVVAPAPVPAPPPPVAAPPVLPPVVDTNCEPPHAPVANAPMDTNAPR